MVRYQNTASHSEVEIIHTRHCKLQCLLQLPVCSIMQLTIQIVKPGGSQMSFDIASRNSYVHTIAVLQNLPCNCTLGFVMFQNLPCICTLGFVMLQNHPCNCTFGFVRLQSYLRVIDAMNCTMQWEVSSITHRNCKLQWDARRISNKDCRLQWDV